MAQNLLTRSNEFSHADWIQFGVNSITPGYANPIDGALTAYRVQIPSGNNMGILQRPSWAKGKTVTLSVWARATSGTAVLRLRLPVNPGFTGAISADTPLTTEWQRISLSSTITNDGVAGTANAIIGNDSTNAAQDVVLYGAQLVQANWPGDYTPTTSVQVGPLTPPPNMVSDGGQNTIIQSSGLATASWAKARCSITPAAATNPIDGALTAEAIVEDASLNSHAVYTVPLPVLVVGRTYTLSWYVKASARTWCIFECDVNIGFGRYFNLSGAGAVGGVIGGTTLNPQIAAVPGYAGWYRVSVSWVATTTYCNPGMFPASGDGGISFQGVNGQVAMYCYGAQLVQGNQPGDYTPTTTAAIGTTTPPLNLASEGGQNLLLYSEQLNHAQWNQRGTCSVTANQIANPVDGAITADLLTGVNISGNDIYQYNPSYLSLAGRKVTPSFWIKRVSATGTVQVTNSYNSLLYGTLTVDLSLIGSDWVRLYPGCVGVTVTIPFIVSATGNVGCLFMGSAGAPLSFYLFGAQVVQGNQPGEYQPTTTAAVGTTTPPLNMPPTQQNLLLQSRALNTSWTQSNISVAVDQVAHPVTGLLTVDKLSDTAFNGQHYLSQVAAPVVIGAVYTVSALVKATSSGQNLKMTGAGVNNGVYYNLVAGTIITQLSDVLNAGIEPLLGQVGWYRIWLTYRLSGSGTIYIVAMNEAPTNSYIGDGTRQYYVTDLQLVQGSTPGPFCPTTTVAINDGAMPRFV